MILTENLDEHPAVQAWWRNYSLCELPSQITILKKSRQSTVYRLHDIGPDGTVIAKLCEAEPGRRETVLYRDVFPKISAATPAFLGFEEDPERKTWWMFIEDGGDETCTPCERDRELAVRWLAALHTSSYLLDLTFLPDVGPNFHLNFHLYAGRERIIDNLKNAAFSTEDRAVLKQIISDLEDVIGRWDQVTQFCATMPKTLVHGDFARKNIRIKWRDGKPAFLTFDWEDAGYGVPAVDMADCPNVHAYWVFVQEIWPHLHESELQQLLLCGRMFGVLAALRWKSSDLAFEWSHREIDTMREHKSELNKITAALGWA